MQYSEWMKCILNYCVGSISLHCNFWHVILDAWPRELDWELASSKITELMSPHRILVKYIWPLFTDIIHTYRFCFSNYRQGKFWTWEQTIRNVRGDMQTSLICYNYLTRWLTSSDFNKREIKRPKTPSNDSKQLKR